MAIERNLANKKPTFIIAQDVKSGYNNVVIQDLLKTFRKHSNTYYSRERKEYCERQQELDHIQYE